MRYPCNPETRTQVPNNTNTDHHPEPCPEPGALHPEFSTAHQVPNNTNTDHRVAGVVAVELSLLGPRDEVLRPLTLNPTSKTLILALPKSCTQILRPNP